MKRLLSVACVTLGLMALSTLMVPVPAVYADHQLEGFTHDECTTMPISGGRTRTFCSRRVEEKKDNNTALIAGGVVGGLAVAGGALWYFWPEEAAALAGHVSFKQKAGISYLPNRSWMGTERHLTEQATLSSGMFWIQDGELPTRLPGNQDLGIEFSMAYQTSRTSALSLGSAVRGGGRSEQEVLNMDVGLSWRIEF